MARGTPPEPEAVPLSTKVEFLSRPESYPERPQAVEPVETHMSWVFLTDRHAYKLKKPVRYPYLDFSTQERRHRYCSEEVRLNRRFARDVYLGVAALTLSNAGTLAIDGEGAAVDTLVRMRRLPRKRTLEHMIREGRWRPADVADLARMLAEFYRRAAPVGLTPEGYRDRLAREIRGNAEGLQRFRAELPAGLIERVTGLQQAFVAWSGVDLERRAAARRIVEAHGDLRPEHVFLDGAPLIIDCLEFRRAFRLLDPADELAFLAMECERLGAPEVERILFDVYASVTGDRPPAGLVSFYKAYRATVRARLAISHLQDEAVADPAKWRLRAADYLALAARELRRPPGNGRRSG